MDTMFKINGHRVFSHSATFYISHYNSYIELLSPYKYSSTPCLKSTYIIPYKFYGGLSIEVLPKHEYYFYRNGTNYVCISV